jgi:hypothetical protein
MSLGGHKVRHILYWVLPIIVAVGIVATLVCSCGNENAPPPDVPTLSRDAVCAIVYNYLKSEIDDIERAGIRIRAFEVLNEGAPQFVAVYASQGRWTVSALGYGYDPAKKEWLYYYIGGSWDVYEMTGVVEPRNDMARALLEYLGRYRS